MQVQLPGEVVLGFFLALKAQAQIFLQSPNFSADYRKMQQPRNFLFKFKLFIGKLRLSSVLQDIRFRRNGSCDHDSITGNF